MLLFFFLSSRMYRQGVFIWDHLHECGSFHLWCAFVILESLFISEVKYISKKLDLQFQYMLKYVVFIFTDNSSTWRSSNCGNISCLERAIWSRISTWTSQVSFNSVGLTILLLGICGFLFVAFFLLYNFLLSLWKWKLIASK